MADARTPENAPAYVRQRGGVLLSMWMTGAGENDIEIAGGIMRRCERYRDALERNDVDVIHQLGPDGDRQGRL